MLNRSRALSLSLSLSVVPLSGWGNAGTPPSDAKVGSCGPTCAGTGQHASWLTWAELADDGGAESKPSIVKHVTCDNPASGPVTVASFNC